MRGDKRTTDDVQRDIEDTRARIRARAEALKERVTPGGIAEELVHRARTSEARRFADNLGRSVRDHPLPVVLTAVGLTWLATSSRNGAPPPSADLESTREKARRLAAVARRTAATLGAGARGAGATVRSGARNVRRGAHAAGEHAAEGGLAVGRTVKHGAERVHDGWDRVVEEQPLLVGLLGMALGAAAGALLPQTRRENQWMGRASDDLKLRTAEQGHRAAEHLRETLERKLDPEAPSASDAQPEARSEPDGTLL